MVEFEITTDIDRPIDEVFAYATDLNKTAEWVSAVVEVKDADWPGLGAKATQVGKFLGQRLEFTLEVVEWEPSHKWAFTASVPFTIRNEVTFTPRGSGTRLHALQQAEVGTFFKVGEPIVAAIAKRQLTSDYANLKQLLEAGVAASGNAEKIVEQWVEGERARARAAGASPARTPPRGRPPAAISPAPPGAGEGPRR